MKKLVFAALAALTLASCAQPSAVENTEKGIRMAYVRIDSLQNQYTYFQELSDELAQEEEVLVAELSRRQQNLQEDVQLYQQEAPRMSAKQREAAEADLMRVQQQYMQIEQAAQQQLAMKQGELGLMMKEDMDKAIEVLKKELNLDFILLYEEGGQLLYANTDFDITARMVELLNDNRETPSEEEAADTTTAE